MCVRVCVCVCVCVCSWDGLLGFENEEYVVFYLLSGQGLASPSCCFGVSVHRGQTPAAHPGAHLSPASKLLGPFGLSQVLPITFWRQHHVPYREGTSCCETTHASGLHRAWPRRGVSVNGSLTQLFFLLRNGLGFREGTSEMNLKPRSPAICRE